MPENYSIPYFSSKIDYFIGKDRDFYYIFKENIGYYIPLLSKYIIENYYYDNEETKAFVFGSNYDVLNILTDYITKNNQNKLNKDNHNYISYVENTIKILKKNEFEKLLESFHPGKEKSIFVDDYQNNSNSELIIGISTAKGIDLVGQHAFLMYIDKTDYTKSIMLDASGSYGEKINSKARSSDVVEPIQIEISIEKYLEFFKDKKQELTVFRMDLNVEEGDIIKGLILSCGKGYTQLMCTEITTTILRKSKLFPSITWSKMPVGLLNDMNRFIRLNKQYKLNPNLDIIVEKYDFQTMKRIDN